MGHHEQRGTLQHPDPREVMGVETGNLGEGEDEDQVEEELQGLDALLIAGVRLARPGVGTVR